MGEAKDIEPVRTLESWSAEVMLLEYLAQGDRDFREGRVMADSEADRHFRASLAKIDVDLGRSLPLETGNR